LINSTTVTVIWAGTDIGTGISEYKVGITDGHTYSAHGVSLNTAWTFGDLSEGSHTVIVTAFDGAGNSNQTMVTFTVDSVAPMVWMYSVTGSVAAIPDNHLVNVTFSEPMNQSSTVMTVNGVDLPIAWLDNQTANVPFSGDDIHSYLVNVTGKDLAGNWMSFSWQSNTTDGSSSIAGVIRDSGGSPISGAEVILSGRDSVRTDVNGHFTIGGVAPGTYRLTVNKEGYQVMTVDVTVVAGEAHDIGAMSLQASVVPFLSNEGMALAILAMVIFAVIAVAVVFLLRRRKA
jgi:hypothetical protein